MPTGAAWRCSPHLSLSFLDAAAAVVVRERRSELDFRSLSFRSRSALPWPALFNFTFERLSKMFRHNSRGQFD